MLGGVFIHAVFFRLSLRVFLHAMHCGVCDYAGNRDGMTYMFSERDGVTLDLPSAAFRRSEFVLVGVVALLKAASERPRFLVGRFCCVLCSGHRGNAGKHEQREKRHGDLDFHSLPPKLRFEEWMNRPELG